ncbi:hypothetical protein DB347_25315 [Opitutaceae bacterium EW11]|nr:hypothetical protein DB347_25315 [Opitutaceae bacterium EW11]
MHATKVVLLLVAFLLVLRLLSWGFGWPLHKWTRLSRSLRSALVNGASYALYLLFLIWDRIPGDTLDGAAVVVGGLVYCAYFVIDTKWLPWKDTKPNVAQS